jgi:hypothetical protein
MSPSPFQKRISLLLSNIAALYPALEFTPVGVDDSLHHCLPGYALRGGYL